MDFDDLLLNTEALFAQFPEARFAESSRFDHVLVDEYQDTNDLQYRILKSLADRHRNLCVVGDDDQSIYGWRGAEIAHILGFQRDWPEAKIIRLEENYRSTEPILKLANTLINHNTDRHPKTLRATREGGFDPRFLRFEDEVAESEGIVREIDLRLNPKEPGPKVIPSDIAILFRTNEQPRAFELELRRAGIAYKLVGGLSFYDRREIRDTLAFLRVLANPSDEVSLLRTINLPPRGIGASTIDVLMKVAVARGVPLWAVLPEAPANGDIAHGVGDRIEGFRRMIEGFRARLGKEPLFQLATELITAVDYRSEVRRLYKEQSESESRWNSVEAFLNSIALYEQRHEDASLVGFLEETALAGRDDFKDDDERQPHAITLMTLHSAKGLEFPHVYLVGMEEGLLPHARSIVEGRGIDEERRLCYVGVTRAQSTLTLTFAKGRVKWGKSRPSIPSRFLMEMRGDTEKAARAAAAAQAVFGRGELGGDGAEAEAPPSKQGGATKGAKRGAKPAGAATSSAPARSKTTSPSRGAEADPAAAKRVAQSSKALSSASKRASS
jgi:DNA helicase-2/ATP-dependent DNA helicase PcrA